jgi:Mg/Co/Ni transporter MgtE
MANELDTENLEPENQELLQDLSEQGKTAELVEMFEELPTMDVAEFMEEKPIEEVIDYLKKLDPEDQGRIFSDFSQILRKFYNQKLSYHRLGLKKEFFYQCLVRNLKNLFLKINL